MSSGFETIIILDFGSQYTQLIARRVRELGVYCEIHPFSLPPEKLEKTDVKGIILSGGPSSVYDQGAPHCSPEYLNPGVPVLGICYGLQLISYFRGGRVEPSDRREYGFAEVRRIGESTLLNGLPAEFPVWMSHGDQVVEGPPGFETTALTGNCLGAVENLEQQIFGIQFHPEVVHTPLGIKVLENFILGICGCRGDWTPHSFVETAVARIRDQIGDSSAVCGLSGGVDSTVAAALVSRAIGDRLTCLFIDNGLLRKGEFEAVLESFRGFSGLRVRGIAAGERFLAALRDEADPERKRKIIGSTFIDVFDEESHRLGNVDFLVQGTLYPDIIESQSVRGPSAVIKSHHNVGGLPERMKLGLVEPLRELFKDEVRQVGRELGVAEDFISRQPFPGPGLAVRIVGPVDCRLGEAAPGVRQHCR